MREGLAGVAMTEAVLEKYARQREQDARRVLDKLSALSNTPLEFMGELEAWQLTADWDSRELILLRQLSRAVGNPLKLRKQKASSGLTRREYLMVLSMCPPDLRELCERVHCLHSLTKALKHYSQTRAWAHRQLVRIGKRMGIDITFARIITLARSQNERAESDRTDGTLG
jgi:hypothetical protein